jgi:hypothetical protein
VEPKHQTKEGEEMRDMIGLAIKIIVVAGLIALGFWYSFTIYAECRQAGGGALLCLHILKR